MISSIACAVVAQIDHQHNSRKQQQNIAWISRFERAALFIAVYAANQLCNFGHLLSPLRLQVYCSKYTYIYYIIGKLRKSKPDSAFIFIAKDIGKLF